MELSQALENIKHFGKKLARDEITCIRENRAAAIPVLLDIVRNTAENFDEIPNSLDDIEDPLYAMFLLAEFRVNDAIEPILRLLELDEDKCRWLFADLITEDMNSLIASVATVNDVARIKVVVENTSLGVYQRTAALSALVIMYAEGIYPRAGLIEYLGSLFDMYSDDMEFISLIICDCEDVLATEHYPRILDMYEQGKVLTEIIDSSEFTNVSEVPLEEDVINSLKANTHTQLITDTIKSMQWWACFNENNKPLPSKPLPMTKKKSQQKPPVIDNKKIGRNEFCPCGSGKKYKKCCMNI